MHTYMKFDLFLLELKNLLDKYMLQLTDKVYFMDNTKHYELEYVEDCFLVTCVETSETEKYYTDKIHVVNTDEVIDDYYPEDEDDEEDEFFGI